MKALVALFAVSIVAVAGTYLEIFAVAVDIRSQIVERLIFKAFIGYLD